MREKPSLKAKKNGRTIYAFDIPSSDYYDALTAKRDIIVALIAAYMPYCASSAFGKEIVCYETEQQCLEAYNAFHKLIPSATYIGRGEVHDD